MGIEPTQSAWKAEVLPLNYTRIVRFDPRAALPAPTRRTTPTRRPLCSALSTVAAAHRQPAIRLTSPHLGAGGRLYVRWRGEDYSTPPALRPSGRRARTAFSGAARLRRTSVRFASSPERVRRRPCIHLVEGGGFEPPKAEPSDLQSDPFDRSGTPPKKRRYSVGTAVCCQLSELTAKSGRRSSDTKTRVVAFRARMAGSGIYAACR